MPGSVRVLGPADRTNLMNWLGQRPVENLFAAAKITAHGFERRQVGVVHGFERDGELRAVCLQSGSIFLSSRDAGAIEAFAIALGRRRHATSLFGTAPDTLRLYESLAARWPDSWAKVSNIRERQPLLLLDRLPTVAHDSRVRVLRPGDFTSYLEACVHMYTEEIGSSPYRYGPGYESVVTARLKQREAYGIVENGRVIFKADLGSGVGDHVQVQGVWVHPDYRGQRLAVPAMAGMLQQVMQTRRHVSLYVNDFNIAAIRTYQRLGFRAVGSLSTVHY
ncbi:MAG: GNAT family N-acetyltransferase [Arachnia propionica]|nr:MAG: GNAT family N-acetyltransferase [Arachnia propionica]